MPRYWTLAEARAALPEAMALVEQLREQLRRARSAAERSAASSRRLPSGGVLSGNGHAAADPAGEIERQARQVMERIDALGFQVKDVEAGLIDFPYLRNGETVLLCYRMGEADILFWHDQESGFAGRRPVDEL